MNIDNPVAYGAGTCFLVMRFSGFTGHAKPLIRFFLLRKSLPFFLLFLQKLPLWFTGNSVGQGKPSAQDHSFSSAVKVTMPDIYYFQ